MRAAYCDELSQIEGIGPKVAKALNEAGISTFDALSKAKVEDLQKILSSSGLKMMDPTTWPEQARNWLQMVIGMPYRSCRTNFQADATSLRPKRNLPQRKPARSRVR